jgi:hypothetical protein
VEIQSGGSPERSLPPFQEQSEENQSHSGFQAFLTKANVGIQRTPRCAVRNRTQVQNSLSLIFSASCKLYAAYFISNKICNTEMLICKPGDVEEGRKQKQLGKSWFYDLEKILFFHDIDFLSEKSLL